jgi:hypothetical protein
LQGQKVISLNTSKPQNTVNISVLKSGGYIVKAGAQVNKLLVK